MNLIDWSLQDDVLLQIRSKGMVQKPIKPLSDASRIFLKTLLMFLLPVLSIAAGFYVWQREKVRRALLPIKYNEL
jgi:ABC-type uncharacterized transport system involved in gliding motility auxiliary subunit